MEPAVLFGFFMASKGVLLVSMIWVAVAATRRMEKLKAERLAREAEVGRAEPAEAIEPVAEPLRRAA